MIRVEPAAWPAALAAAVADGYAFPEFLMGADDGTAIRVITRLRRLPDGATAELETAVAHAGSLASVAPILPGLSWHERETAELLGIRFEGGDDRPLVLRDASGPAPLLRSTPLPARVATPWPGAAEPGMREGAEGMQRRAGNPSRRRQRPPGVPDSWTAP